RPQPHPRGVRAPVLCARDGARVRSPVRAPVRTRHVPAAHGLRLSAVDPKPAVTAASFLTHVLKDGDSFLVANAYGDIEGEADGLFHDDTRWLSVFRLRLAGSTPDLLSSAVTRDNVFFVAHLTNRPLP